jgi:hypothetical protein
MSRSCWSDEGSRSTALLHCGIAERSRPTAGLVQIARASSVNAAATRAGWNVVGEFVVAAAQVLLESVPGDDRLPGPSGSQAAHRSEPVLELAVICFDRIVSVPFDVMPRRRDQLLHDCVVDPGGVGDDLARRHLQRGQRCLEEPTGRGRIPVRRDEHVDDLTVLVDGPVHVPPDIVDLYVLLIYELAERGRLFP